MLIQRTTIDNSVLCVCVDLGYAGKWDMHLFFFS